MKKGYLLTASILILLANMTFINYIAQAETCVGGGPLSITTLPSTANFPPTETSLTDITGSLAFGSTINFEDMRQVSDGFTLTVTSTNFEDINNSGNSFSLSNLSVTSDVNDSIGLVECDDATGITLSQYTFSAFTDSNSDGISDSKTLISGNSIARIGKYSITPELQLTTPGKTTAGTFRTTLTFSIQ